MFRRAAGRELELVPTPDTTPSRPRIENETMGSRESHLESENKQVVRATTKNLNRRDKKCVQSKAEALFPMNYANKT